MGQTLLNAEVFLQRIDGQHVLNQGVKVELICLCTNALIPLKKFIKWSVKLCPLGQRYKRHDMKCRLVIEKPYSHFDMN